MYFYIRCEKKKGSAIRLWGHRIELETYGTFIVDHRHNDADPKQHFIGYCITEPQTGLLVSVDSNVKDAVESLILRLDNRGGIEPLKKLIQSKIAKFGILNEVK